MTIPTGDESFRGRTPTLPPVYNTWLTFDRSWFAKQTELTTTTTTTTTTSTTTTSTPALVSQRKIWYYQDDLGKIQGPFSSRMMSIWEKQGYFR